MERTVNPLASVRCRYFSGAIFNNAGAGAVSARIGDKTPGESASTALVKTARTNKPDKILTFMVPLPIGDCHLAPGHLHFPRVALRTAAQFFLRPPQFVEFHPMEDKWRADGRLEQAGVAC
jgi:hypothetical protein